ncbi:GNAT family N-acetyltransferase [Kordiimonas gwangyangensis]|uniref:GNAT family N-acetyltransferase n=2 Tax=Kordiimonas gwangyangensis TaxID=288022 RepID=UPI000475E765|nr:GNAT family protein [Kordiimonas gwangyangensis]
MSDLSNWKPCATPGRVALDGTYTRLEPLNWDTHGEGLATAVAGHDSDELWHYMAYGPFEGVHDLRQAFDAAIRAQGWCTMVIRARASGEILGMASYMRNRETMGSTEVGCVTFAKKLQRTTIATEAIYLMARHVFEDLGYRRFEWKCHAQNAASMRAAVRFGFIYEGTFRNDMVFKGRNRDTAWYSMIDSEWPDLDAAFRAWLSPENFDEAGQQRATLEAYRKALQAA